MSSLSPLVLLNPFALPPPDYSNTTEVNEQMRLLVISHRHVRQAEWDNCIVKWVCIPLVVATCGCGGLFCLGCASLH